MNILLFMSDNQSAEFIGCYGNDEVLTPNIDKLSKTGKLFSSAFCTNAMCSPCRASVLTGLMPSAHGIHNWLDDNLENFWPDKWNAIGEFESFPERLKDAGYTNALIGKYALSKQSLSSRSQSMALNLLYGLGERYDDENIKKIKRLTPEDLRKCCQKYFDTSSKVTVQVIPNNK